jgi:anaerobic magnesium-protoporphyrin IX monomethyl ester cyclase
VAHTFRGSTLRSLVGLEDERAAFARYKSLRRAEREYVPDGAAGSADTLIRC